MILRLHEGKMSSRLIVENIDGHIKGHAWDMPVRRDEGVARTNMGTGIAKH